LRIGYSRLVIFANLPRSRNRGHAKILGFTVNQYPFTAVAFL